MSGEGNTCCICLESLFSENDALGVTKPCGHPIHENCFRGWEASTLAKGYGRERVRCPNCNRGGAMFMKIFLSLPTADVDTDDDDDSSVESSSEKPAEDNNNDMVEEKPDNDNDDDVVDLTASPPKEDNRSKDYSRTDEGTAKVKKRLKRYKLQYKQCHSKFQECSKKQQEILDRHQAMKRELEEAKHQAEETQEIHDSNLLELSQRRLEHAQLQRDLDEANHQRKKVEDELQKMNDAFEKERSQYADRLHQARYSRSVETKKIMDDYPKVLEELQRTKRKLEEKEKFCASIRTRLKQLAPKYKEDLAKIAEEAETSQDSRKQRKRRLEILKEMNNEDEAFDAQKRRREQERKAELTARKMATPRAMQMVNAAAKAKKAKSIGSVLGLGIPSSARRAYSNQADVLLGNLKRRHCDSGVSRDSSLHATAQSSAAGLHLSTKVKRKPTVDRNMAGFAKTNSQKNGSGKMDIRAMFRRAK